ncbi:carbohydrate esterase family 16 protein [Apiospora marii]|uniref:Carbohydrate esterase family 16 protein n=1 Tax=Apiospora marii TaxID=335849 RepID=A0ABR1RYY7_9PEZI
MMPSVFRSQFLLALLATTAASAPSHLKPKCTASSEWPGWNGIKHAFVLSATLRLTQSNPPAFIQILQLNEMGKGFDHTLTQPSPTNPLGNPGYPGYTSSNGPNWVDYLTVKYNASLLQTYNLAVGGATVDSALVKPYKPEVLSVKQQAQDVFLPTYASSSSSQWTGGDSLFAFWIGINDVGNSYWQDDTPTLNRQIFAVYADVVRRLYRDAGARHFLFLNVPPVDRSPLTVGQGATAVEREAADIAAFNALTAALAADLAAEGQDGGDKANVWTYDVHALFTEVLDRPAAYEATAGYANTTGFCAAYQNGTPNQDTLDPACGVPVNEYFWLNNLHPTYPVHDVVAEQVAAALAQGPNVC